MSKKQLTARVYELEAALRHAQEALFWYHGENFEMDGRKAGDVIEAALRPKGVAQCTKS